MPMSNSATQSMTPSQQTPSFFSGWAANLNPSSAALQNGTLSITPPPTAPPRALSANRPVSMTPGYAASRPLPPSPDIFQTRPRPTPPSRARSTHQVSLPPAIANEARVSQAAAFTGWAEPLDPTSTLFQEGSSVLNRCGHDSEGIQTHMPSTAPTPTSYAATHPLPSSPDNDRNPRPPVAATSISQAYAASRPLPLSPGSIQTSPLVTIVEVENMNSVSRALRERTPFNAVLPRREIWQPRPSYPVSPYAALSRNVSIPSLHRDNLALTGYRAGR